MFADTGFEKKDWHPENSKICRRGEWNSRIIVETVLFLFTLVSHLKKVIHRKWAYFKSRLAFTMAMFNILVHWDGLQVDDQGCVHFFLGSLQPIKLAPKVMHFTLGQFTMHYHRKKDVPGLPPLYQLIDHNPPLWGRIPTDMLILSASLYPENVVELQRTLDEMPQHMAIDDTLQMPQLPDTDTFWFGEKQVLAAHIEYMRFQNGNAGELQSVI
ncbi:MAG: hypothetical protein JXB07_20435 [Anaerolineae bacterium]|nr:hypothetical protein [Anaerolineae bacterium]